MYGRAPFPLSPWVLRLLIANGIVYFLTITVFTGPWFYGLFAFSPGAALQQPWTAVTYMFIHGSFLHIALNMLMLFFFGPAVEEQLGGSAFVRYYFLCGLGGALFSFAVALVWPVQPFVGASAAVFGVSLAFALYWPDAPIFVFPIPVPIKAKWLVIGLATLDLALAVSRASDGVAHLAHLGGFLAGLTYLKGGTLLAPRSTRVPRREVAVRVLVPPAGARAEAEGAAEPAPPAPRRDAAAMSEKVNRVLDKILASGMESLTEEERRILDDMSRQLRDR